MSARLLGLLFLTLACLLFPVLLPAADPKLDAEKDAEAKKKLEQLKARLPAVLKTWSKEEPSLPIRYSAELRICRRTAVDVAKITIVCRPQGKAASQISSEVITALLAYQDGSWTTTRFDSSLAGVDPRFARATFFLMLAIDEAGEH